MSTSLYCYDGRHHLEYGDYGDKSHPVVVAFHGLLGGAKLDQLGVFFSSHNRRLISVTRPGYGNASPVEFEHYRDITKLYQQLLDHLEITQCELFGISAGAPHAYQLAALDGRVSKVWIFSGLPLVCDPDILKLYPPTLEALYELARNSDRISVGNQLHDMLFPEVSPELLESEMYQFTMAHGGFALGQEIHFQASMTCEEFENITAPIVLQHSKVDTMVPFVAAEETARKLGAEFISEEQGEHADLDNMQKLLSLMVS